MYRYYSTLRPLGLGTAPILTENNPTKIANFDERKFVSEIGREAWGYVEYPKPLEDAELKAYDLVGTGRQEDKDSVCRLLGKLLQKTVDGKDIDRICYHTEDDTAEVAMGHCHMVIVLEGTNGLEMIEKIISELLKYKRWNGGTKNAD